MECKDCRNWTTQKDTDFYKDMGKCAKLSAKDGEEYPNLDESGVESTPLCAHDGAGSEYETKSWFGCIHFEK
jgi:hypothetical protein